MSPFKPSTEVITLSPQGREVYLALSVSKKQIVVSNQIQTQTALWPPWQGSCLEWGPILRKRAKQGCSSRTVRASQPECLGGIPPAAGAESLAPAPGSPGFWVPRHPQPHLLVQLPELGWETGVCSCPALLQVRARLEPKGPSQLSEPRACFPSAPGEAEERKFLSHGSEL